MPYNPRIDAKATSEGLDLTFYGPTLGNIEILRDIKTIQELFEVATLLQSPTGLLRVQAFEKTAPIIDIRVEKTPVPQVA